MSYLPIPSMNIPGSFCARRNNLRRKLHKSALKRRSVSVRFWYVLFGEALFQCGEPYVRINEGVIFPR